MKHFRYQSIEWVLVPEYFFEIRSTYRELINYSFFVRVGNRFATFDSTVDCLRSLGVAQASSLLEALSFRNHPSQKISLRDLVGALQEEMNASLEAGMLANNGHSGTALHSGILLMQHELSSVR